MPITDADKALAEQVRNATKPGFDEHEKRTKVYDRAYEVYRASGRSPEGTEPWQSKLRVKYAMYNIDTALVNIISGSPRGKVIPRNPNSATKAKAFQSVLDYYTQRADLASVQPMVAQQALIYGVTGGKTSWRFEERNQNRRVYQDNPFGGPPLSGGVQNQTVVTHDGPAFEPWDMYDMWWDPFGRSVDDCAYVVLRSWPSKQDLLENQNLYRNLDELFQSGDATDRAQTAQDRRVQAERKMRGRFEIWEVWTNDRVIVIGNRNTIIRDDPNPHWHGQKPIVVASGRPDLFKMHGIPETELIDHIQEALWTIQNMRTDQLKLTVMRGLTYREGGVQDPNLLVLRPRFRWPVSDHDDVQFQAPPPLPPEAYQEQSTLLGQMETITGISPYVSGNVPTSVSHTTATSVSLLQQAATRLLQFKGTMLNNLCWQRVFEQWGADIQQFMTQPVWARIVHGNDVAFERVEPWQVAGEYDFHISGADEASSKDQERQQALQLLQALAPIIPAAPGLNLRPLIERVAEAFDLPNPEELLGAQGQNPQQPPAAPQPQGGGQFPNAGTQIALPPGVQQAIAQGGMGG